MVYLFVFVFCIDVFVCVLYLCVCLCFVFMCLFLFCIYVFVCVWDGRRGEGSKPQKLFATNIAPPGFSCFEVNYNRNFAISSEKGRGPLFLLVEVFMKEKMFGIAPQ